MDGQAEVAQTFAQAFREARKAAGASRAFTAEVLGVSAGAVESWERGTIPEERNFKAALEWFPTLRTFDRAHLTRRLSFASRLREVRIAHGLSQHELALRIGVHERTVGDWERGTQPRKAILPRLTSALPDLRGARYRRSRPAGLADTGSLPTPTTVRSDEQVSREPVEKAAEDRLDAKTEHVADLLSCIRAVIQSDVSLDVLWLIRFVVGGGCSAKALSEVLALGCRTSSRAEACDE